MNAEELKQLGIEDPDLAQKVIIAHGKDIEKLKSERDELTAAKTDLETKFGEATKQIVSFQAMKPEEAQAAAKEWQSKYEQAQVEKTNAINQLKYDTLIENALRDAKAKNLKAARAVIDEKDLKLGEDGSVAGLKERVDKAISENGFLFGAEVDVNKPRPPRVTTTTTSQPPAPIDKEMADLRKGAGLPPLRE